MATDAAPINSNHDPRYLVINKMHLHRVLRALLDDVLSKLNNIFSTVAGATTAPNQTVGFHAGWFTKYGFEVVSRGDTLGVEIPGSANSKDLHTLLGLLYEQYGHFVDKNSSLQKSIQAIEYVSRDMPAERADFPFDWDRAADSFAPPAAEGIDLAQKAQLEHFLYAINAKDMQPLDGLKTLMKGWGVDYDAYSGAGPVTVKLTEGANLSGAIRHCKTVFTKLGRSLPPQIDSPVPAIATMQRLPAHLSLVAPTWPQIRKGFMLALASSGTARVADVRYFKNLLRTTDQAPGYSDVQKIAAFSQAFTEAYANRRDYGSLSRSTFRGSKLDQVLARATEKYLGGFSLCLLPKRGEGKEKHVKTWPDAVVRVIDGEKVGRPSVALAAVQAARDLRCAEMRTGPLDWLDPVAAFSWDEVRDTFKSVLNHCDSGRDKDKKALRALLEEVGNLSRGDAEKIATFRKRLGVYLSEARNRDDSITGSGLETAVMLWSSVLNGNQISTSLNTFDSASTSSSSRSSRATPGSSRASSVGGEAAGAGAGAGAGSAAAESPKSPSPVSPTTLDFKLVENPFGKPALDAGVETGKSSQHAGGSSTSMPRYSQSSAVLMSRPKPKHEGGSKAAEVELGVMNQHKPIPSSE